jgi:hypothetical protein
MAKRSHITLHEFCAEWNEDRSAVVISEQPRCLKVTRIDDVVPIKPNQRASAYWNEQHKAQPLPSEFQTHVHVSGYSVPLKVRESVEEIQNLIDGTESEATT